MKLATLFSDWGDYLDRNITVNGWVKTCRKQKKMLFIQLSDGTTQNCLQIIVSPEKVSYFEDLCKLTTGSSIKAIGLLIKSPAQGQDVELSATSIEIYQICPGTFPMQKVGLPLEFLREHLHLRHRTNLMRAVFAVKSKITKCIHDFLTSRNYCYVDIPMITTNACEGGCQPLQVTSLLNDGLISKIPLLRPTDPALYSGNDKYFEIITEMSRLANTIANVKIDFSKDFFDNPVYLTVSNQLHLECVAHGMGYVYTMTQASRGEPSQSTKHLATFNMLEIEFCFGELSDNIDIAESLIKYCVSSVLQDVWCSELEVLNKAAGGTLLEKLYKIMDQPFERISHRAAIDLLRQAHAETAFQEKPKYSEDLTGEHERYLVAHFGKPVVVMYYPKAVKAFYMPVHHCETIDGETIEYVDCFDLLMDIGEVVGGSQRIWSETELVDRMTELAIDPAHLSWYVDLRKYGSVPHGGFGLGLERLVAVITGMANVKDCTSFPITIHHCKF